MTNGIQWVLILDENCDDCCVYATPDGWCADIDTAIRFETEDAAEIEGEMRRLDDPFVVEGADVYAQPVWRRSSSMTDTVVF